jgi:hypothetical protein
MGSVAVPKVARVTPPTSWKVEFALLHAGTSIAISTILLPSDLVIFCKLCMQHIDSGQTFVSPEQGLLIEAHRRSRDLCMELKACVFRDLSSKAPSPCVKSYPCPRYSVQCLHHDTRLRRKQAANR